MLRTSRSGRTQISGPLGQVFGQDPVQFISSVVRRNPSAWANVCERVAARTGKTELRYQTAAGRAVSVPLRASPNATTPRLAASVAACAAGHPRIFVDEASRYAWGMPRARDATSSPLALPRTLRNTPAGLTSPEGTRENMGPIADQLASVAAQVLSPLAELAAGAGGGAAGTGAGAGTGAAASAATAPEKNYGLLIAAGLAAAAVFLWT